MPSSPVFVLLPGTSSPTGSESYVRVYSAIEREANRLGYDYHLVDYPGQAGVSSGVLRYETALASALTDCRRLEPERLIARSFGCNVAAGVLGSGEAWVSACHGAVFWGPFFNRAIEDDFGTAAKMEQRKLEYQEYGVHLADDLFSALPDLSGLICDVRCNIRLARGSLDKYNTSNDLSELGTVHRHHASEFECEVSKVEGAEHAVNPGEVSQDVLAQYLRCLFVPIGQFNNPNVPT